MVRMSRLPLVSSELFPGTPAWMLLPPLTSCLYPCSKGIQRNRPRKKLMRVPQSLCRLCGFHPCSTGQALLGGTCGFARDFWVGKAAGNSLIRKQQEFPGGNLCQSGSRATTATLRSGTGSSLWILGISHVPLAPLELPQGSAQAAHQNVRCGFPREPSLCLSRELC